MKIFEDILKKLGIGLIAISVVNTAIADTVTYFHNDLSGSPMAATDASGNLLWKENYKPYGEKLAQAPASAENKVGFHGKAFDNATGLSYMGSRYYDPVIGRFVGVDPVGYKTESLHSFNRYTYANNNPYKYVDPDGQFAFLIPVAVYALTALAAMVTVQTALSRFNHQAQGDIAIGPLSFPGANIDNSNSWSSGQVFNETETNADVGGGDSKQNIEKDSRRRFNRDERSRAQDRSRDEQGDPTCEYCGIKTTNTPGQPNSAQTDHIDAWSKGGRTNDDNAANSCRTCNASKGARDLGTQWLPPGYR